MTDAPASIDAASRALAEWASAAVPGLTVGFVPLGAPPDSGVAGELLLRNASRSTALGQRQPLTHSRERGKEREREPRRHIDARWRLRLISADPLAAQAALTRLLAAEPPAGSAIGESGPFEGAPEILLAWALPLPRVLTAAEIVRERVVDLGSMHQRTADDG